VSGPNVMAGYWDLADATVDVFRKGSYDPIVEACLPLAGMCTGTGSLAVGDPPERWAELCAQRMR
jgi:hypothetical protein